MENVKINTTPKGAKGICYASQYDDGRIVRFNLFSELLPYKLDGSETIKVKVVRPDNVEIIEAVTNTEDYYIDVNISSDMTALAGVASCELEIKKGDTVIGSRNFDMNIESDSYGSDISIGEAQGIIATFETDIIDNLVSLKTTFEPKQDLHGYETPWIDSNVVNKAPYLSRALTGTASRIGNYEYNKLVGGTYAFNQLVPTAIVQVSTTIDEDIPAGSGRWGSKIGNMGVSAIGHKVLGVDIYSNIKCRVSFGANTNSITTGGDAGTESTKTAGVWIGEAHKIGDGAIYFRLLGGLPAGTYNNTIQFFDLTQMFGSTIADYIYSLETAQAGAGVSFFKSLFGADYYAYNAGELMSVKTSAHVTKDANNNVISNIALDPDLELRGIPKLDDNNNLYYDGDTYESNGDVTRRLSSVTLDGNLNPNNLNVTVLSDFTQIGYLPYISIGVGGHSRFLCDKNFVFGSSGAGSIYNSGIESAPRMFLGLPASVTTAAEAVAWFANNPTTVLFYIATPTTESADPFTDPQEIDASGSEEFIDARAVSIPVGHESYYANICEIEGIDSITFYHSGEDTQDPENALVEIGQEVYGGYYDKDLGIVLTKKKIYLNSLTWSVNAPSDTYWYLSSSLENSIDVLNTDTNVRIISEILSGVSAYERLTVNSISIISSSRAFITVLKSVFNTVEDFVSWLTSVNAYAVYELETPIIIPADAVNFETVKGVNNVWSDTNGETEVKFYVKEA